MYAFFHHEVLVMFGWLETVGISVCPPFNEKTEFLESNRLTLIPFVDENYINI
jgi:hypothetical protein